MSHRLLQGIRIFFYTVLTERRKRTVGAGRLACRAYVTTELHNTVAKIALFGWLNQLRKDALDLDGILERFGVHSKATADADAMGVGYNAALVENVTKQQICHLASHPGKSEQLLHRIRKHTVKLLDEHATGILCIL